jgi:hypothetical protein
MHPFIKDKLNLITNPRKLIAQAAGVGVTLAIRPLRDAWAISAAVGKVVEITASSEFMERVGKLGQDWPMVASNAIMEQLYPPAKPAAAAPPKPAASSAAPQQEDQPAPPDDSLAARAQGAFDRVRKAVSEADEALGVSKGVKKKVGDLLDKKKPDRK